MTAPAAELDQRFLALVSAHAAQRTATAANVLALLRRALAELADWYDPVQVARFVAAMTDAVLGGRQVVAGATEAYLRQQLDLFGVPAGKASPVPAAEPRGIPTTEEFVRPVKEFRHARLRGLDQLEAEQRAAQRAELIAGTDLTLAMRDASRDLLEDLDRVVGFRRIIHPELSTGGTCGLCAVASDRLYRRADLLDIHGRCNCTVGVVVRGQPDPGKTLNGGELKSLYEAAGGTGAAALKRVRVATREHGELGPVLVDAGDSFRDAEDVAHDLASADTGAPTPVTTGS